MLEDEHAVQQAINQYGITTGRGDWDPVLALYTEDGVWEIPHLGLSFQGKPALREALAQMAGGMEWVLQLNAPAVIRIDGDTAHARSGIRETGKLKGAEQSVEYIGIYDDTLVRTGAGWKFKKRVFEHIGTLTFPLAAGG